MYRFSPYLRVLSALCFFAFLSSSQAWARPSQVIYDYPIVLEDLTITPVTPAYTPILPEGAIPVELTLKGQYEKNGHVHEVLTQINGVSVPLLSQDKAFLYSQLFVLDQTLYSAASLYIRNEADRRQVKALASIDAEGHVLANLDWNFTAQYREYRYTLEDRLTALAFGTLVHNSEDVSISVEKK